MEAPLVFLPALPGGGSSQSPGFERSSRSRPLMSPRKILMLEEREKDLNHMEPHSKRGSNWKTLSLDKVFDFLDNKSLPKPSIDDYIHILQRCKNQKKKEYVHRVNAHIRHLGFEIDDILGNCLVSSLAEVGSISHAQQVFDSLVIKNQDSWDSLIIGYVSHGKTENAYHLFQRLLKDDSLCPTKHVCVALFKGCSKFKDLKTGTALHAELVEKRLFVEDLYICSSMVDMYAKCGCMENAQSVFDSISIKDIVMWNALIGGYVNQGYGEEAIYCFEQMNMGYLFPNVVTYIGSIKACAIAGAAEKGLEIHAQIVKRGLFEREINLGNVLIDMYAKLSWLDSAQNVFDTLPFKDVVSWTTLITGYINCYQDEQALFHYDQMRVKAVIPTSVTFACVLKACCRTGKSSLGMEIHSELLKRGYDTTHLVGVCLIDMYHKCGFLDVAEELFNKLSSKNVVAWNALISGYAKYDLGKDVLNCFRKMKENGISPDAITYTCCLKACASIRDLDKGEELHRELKRNGMLSKDPVVGNALVEMYTKCGEVMLAREVFDQILVRNVISWNTLIAGYTENEQGEEALKLFIEMQEEGVYPNSVTFVSSLNACSSIGNIEHGQEIHSEIVRKRLEGDPIISGALIDMYGKCGLLANAEEVFNRIIVRDTISWTSLMKGYVDHGQGEKALICMDQMMQQGLPPDDVTIACSLKACANIRALKRGQYIHACIAEALTDDLVLSNELIGMYAKCGFVEKAQESFDNLQNRDLVCWSTLISGYAENEHDQKALNVYKQMQLEVIAPNIPIFVSVLKSCTKLVEKQEGLEVYSQIMLAGLQKDCLVGSALVCMLAKFGLLEEAQNVFDGLLVKDVVAWTALITGYVDQGEFEEGLCSFDQMQIQNVLPDAVTYVCSLRACGIVGAITKGQRIHEDVAKKGLLEHNETIGIALIDMYAKCGFHREAQKVFQMLQVQDDIAWTALIAVYSQIGECDNVFYTLSGMLSEGNIPSAVTFLNVLNACCHAGLVYEGQKYFEIMNRDYGIPPALEHHNCMVDLLARAGQLEKAVELINKMPCEPNFILWQTILVACQKCGNLELAKHAFRKAVILDERNAAAFIRMSNIYADSELGQELMGTQ